MAEYFNNNKNFRAEMHVLRAVKWAIQSWQNDVTSHTIHNCWSRSSCIDFGSAPGNSLNINDIDDIVIQIRDRIQTFVNNSRIKEAMDSNLFLNPNDEEVVDEPFDEMTSHIIACYNEPEIEAKESEEEGETQEKLTHNEAALLLERLQLYESNSDKYADTKIPCQFLKYLQLIKSQEAASKVNQTVLDSWVSGNAGNVE